MAGELFSIYGTTSGAETSGALVLSSDVWYGQTNAFRIPKGMTLKIWEEKATAQRLDLYTEVSTDTGSTYSLIVSELSLQAAGTYTNSRSGRPLVIPSYAGNKLVRFRYANQSSVFVTFNCELAPIE